MRRILLKIYEAAGIVDRFKPQTIHMIGSCTFLTALQLEQITLYLIQSSFFYARLSDWLILQTKAKKITSLGNA